MSNKQEFTISEETRSFLGSEHLLFINGDWVKSSSGDLIPVIDPATGSEAYTRNGQFSYDREGFLSTARGMRIQALEVDRNTGESKGLPGSLKVLGLVDPPSASGNGANGTGVRVAANLDANASVKDVPVDPTNMLDTMYNFAVATSVLDLYGNSHTATVAFRKRPDLPEQIDPATGQPIAGTRPRLRPPGRTPRVSRAQPRSSVPLN